MTPPDSGAAAPVAYAIAVPDVVSLPIHGSSERFPVRRIHCVGRNYLDHIKEMGGDVREPPFFFSKHRDTIVQSGGTMAYPSLTQDLHYELELVVAMKSGGMNIPAETALDHVFGYAVGFDMTRRDLQAALKKKGQSWESGKSFDQAAPCGTVTRASDFSGPAKGRVHLTVNGETRQDSDLSMMIWNVAEIIRHLSGLIELGPGDLIYTGTPDGVGPVVRGDRMVGSIEGLDDLVVDVG